MIVDFKNIPMQSIEHFKGGEKATDACMFVDENCRMLLGRLAPGASIGLHVHDTSSEMVYVLEGRGKALYDGEPEPISAGLCHYCPKGHEHSIINDSEADLVFFAVVPNQ